MTLCARDERLYLQEGIVIVPRVKLTAEGGEGGEGAVSLAEGTRVRIEDRQGGWMHVRCAGREGWVSSASVRPLAKAVMVAKGEG